MRLHAWTKILAVYAATEATTFDTLSVALAVFLLTGRLLAVATFVVRSIRSDLVLESARVTDHGILQSLFSHVGVCAANRHSKSNLHSGRGPSPFFLRRQSSRGIG